MVSLGKSSGALIFSFCQSTTRALLAASSRTSTASTSRASTGTLSQRRRFLTTATGLVTAASFSSFPYTVYAQQGQCDNNYYSPPGSYSSTSRSMSTTTTATGYLNAADAAALDGELMSTPGFCLEQLMELAGLSVAEAVYQVLPPPPSEGEKNKPKILLVCGPGNNGGDGLVAARHLVFFGYECVVVYPKQSSKQHFVNLVQQCKDVDVTILDEMPSSDLISAYDGIVDAIFGFSFKGSPREPFATVMQQMIHAQQEKKIPVISVDVPSGWNVDEGDVASTGFVPDVLVSLTTPKESARSFQGRHFVGGRFLPPKLAEKYKVRMPPYPGVSQVMEVTDTNDENDAGELGSSLSSPSLPSAGGSKSATAGGWEAEYAAYLQEQQKLEHDTDKNDSLPLADDDPQSESTNENDMASWEQQYAEYCAEKEARLANEDAKRTQDLKKLLA